MDNTLIVGFSTCLFLWLKSRIVTLESCSLFIECMIQIRSTLCNRKCSPFRREIASSNPTGHPCLGAKAAKFAVLSGWEGRHILSHLSITASLANHGSV